VPFLVTEAIKSKASSTLSAFPKLNELTSTAAHEKEVVQQQCQYKMEIRQTGSLSQLGNQEQVTITFNGAPIHSVLQRQSVKLTADNNYADLTGDVLDIKVERRRSLNVEKNGATNGDKSPKIAMKLIPGGGNKENKTPELFSKSITPSEVSLRRGETVAYKCLSWTISLKLCKTTNQPV
jgi:hypothetical protein